MGSRVLHSAVIGTQWVDSEFSVYEDRKEARGVDFQWDFRPGIDSLNGKPWAECLNADWFMSLEDTRRKMEDWRRDSNCKKPHSSLNGRTPGQIYRIWLRGRGKLLSVVFPHDEAFSRRAMRLPSRKRRRQAVAGEAWRKRYTQSEISPVSA